MCLFPIFEPMTQPHAPLFIAFEGIDGSGKTTQAKRLADSLTLEGTKIHLTAEPTKRTIGKMIREIFSGAAKADERVIAGLFVADRLDHILNDQDGMLNLLRNGITVISDRYYLSSYAYHGVHTDMDWVINSNAMAAKLLRPDLNIFIDVSPEIAMDRIASGRTGTELYETLDNLKAVRQKYFEAFEKVRGEEKIEIINGDRPHDEVSADILALVSTLKVK